MILSQGDLNDKCRSDRTILRSIDQDAIQHSLPETIGYLLIFTALLYPGGIYADFPRVTIAGGTIIGLLAIVRGISLARFDQLYAPGPRRWRQQFFTLHCLNRLVWGTYGATIIILYGIDSNTFILIAFTAGLCATTLFALAGYRYVYKVSVSFSLLPLILALIYLNSPHSLIYSALLVAFYYSCYRQADRQFEKFWQQVKSTELLKEKAYQFEVAKRESDQSSALKIDFLGNLTREIRTPMSNILGMLSLLGDSNLDKEQTEFQKLATDAGESLLALVDDVLDYSQLATGNIVLDSQTFNLRKIVGEVLEMHGPIAHSKNLELSCVFDPRIPLRVRGDSNRIAQVISNLVSNAIKFSDQGEIIVEVHMTTIAAQEGLLRIHVIDEGSGIETSKQADLFENYSPSSEPRSENSIGAGLGLAICKGLTQKMGGDIGVISTPGQGSTFWFTSKLRISTQQAEQTFPSRHVAGKKALIVNSTVGCSKGLIYELEPLGFLCDEIENNDRALQLLRTASRNDCRYDLVILDLGHQYKGSYKLSSIIAEDPSLSAVKQIILTSLVQRGSEKCVNHKSLVPNLQFVTKPVQRPSLWNSLSKLFNVNRNRDNRIHGIDLRPSDSSAVTPQNDSNSPTQFEKVANLHPNDSTKDSLNVSLPPNSERAEENQKNLVLLVEDNKVNQMVAEAMLASLGYFVKTVNNGKEALGIIADKHFDIILMDCQMPELDGYATTREIRRRQQSSGKRVPIVAMTANAMAGEEAKCLAAGMDDYLSKPVDKDKLELKLKHWLYQEQKVSGVINNVDKGAAG